MFQELLAFIAQAPSPCHTVRAGEAMLTEAGFSPLAWGKPWLLAPGGRYYTKAFGSSLLAFTVGSNSQRGLRIAAAHTDFPGFRVKTSAGLAKDGYGLVNVEPYGGLMLSSWLDRPLSLAGQIVLRGKDAFSPEVCLFDFARPLLTIPRLAIHLDRKVNEGEKLDRQKSMTPLASLLKEEIGGEFFLEKLAREIGRAPEDVLAYDLNVYLAEPGALLGFDGEFISAPRLDNLTSVHACLSALAASSAENGIRVVSLFDHEEVGAVQNKAPIPVCSRTFWKLSIAASPWTPTTSPTTSRRASSSPWTPPTACTRITRTKPTRRTARSSGRGSS